MLIKKVFIFLILQIIILSLFMRIIPIQADSTDLYWFGGTGNWSDSAHWGTATNGSGAPHSAPTSTNNVFFDSNSFTAGSQIVTLDFNAVCANITWSSVTNTPTFTGVGKTLTIYGSAINFSATMLVSGTITFILTGSNTATKTFIGGNLIFYALTIQGTGAFITTFDAYWSTFGVITVDRSEAAKTIIITAGTYLKCTDFICATSGITVLTIGSTTTASGMLRKYGNSPVNLDYLAISYIAAQYTNIWYYGTHSTIGSGVTGWFTGSSTPLRTIAPIAYSALLTSIRTGDGCILSGSYIYVLSRDDKKMAKIDISDMSTTIDKTFSEANGPRGDCVIMGIDGYLWTSSEASGYICKINPSDLSLIASYEVLPTLGVSVLSLTDDVDYVYCGGRVEVEGTLLFSRFNKSTYAVTDAPITITGLPVASYIHSLTNDSTTVYGYVVSTTGRAISILKSSLSASYFNIDAVKHDDIAMDTSYFYGAKTNIVKTSKSDLTNSYITLTDLVLEVDGFILFDSGQIMANDSNYEGDGNVRIHLTDTSQIYSGYVLASGLQDNGPGVLYKSNELIYSGEFLYLMTFNFNNVGVRFYKFNLSDISLVIAPTITLSSITNIDNPIYTGDAFATLNGNITDTGGENPTITVYWGYSDGTTIPGNWLYYVFLPSQGVAPFLRNITSGFGSNTIIYVSASAANSAGTSWPVASLSFLTPPSAPTGVLASDGNSAIYVTVSWNGSAGATSYHVFRDATDLGAQTSPFNDIYAPSPTITTGTTTASDGTSYPYVTLNAVGASVSNGTSSSYTVVAYNATSASLASNANTGYRGVGTLTYQWQRSAGITNDTYLDIGTTGVTAITNPYLDIDAPADGSVRWFRCVLSATGATQAISTPDSGYRASGVIAPTIIISSPTSVGAITATLNGNITVTGGDNPTVTVYWGTTNGGNTPINWAHSVTPPTSPSQPQGVTSFYYNVTGLSSGTLYYFSASATNSSNPLNPSWPATSLSFLTKPAAPTGVSATDGTQTGWVTVSWNGSAGATGYKLYRDGVLFDTVGNVLTDDDLGANAPTITAVSGDVVSASASDGSYSSFVVLNVNAIANHGIIYSYTVVAYNTTGDSLVSVANTGYRGVGTLTYQWQRSAGDSDNTYTDIGTAGVTAITNPYDDLTGVVSPDGRWYRCVLSATGATQVISIPDRGYLSAGSTTPAVVTTSIVINITLTTATSGGDIQSIGSTNVTERGICYGTSINPTISGTKVSETSTSFPSGSYFENMTGLISATMYHVRAYAINSGGISYGADVSFATLASPLTNPTWDWYFPITIKDTTGADRENISVDTGVSGTVMHQVGYMDANGMDTNVQLGGDSVPYMIGTTKTFIDVASLPANSQVTYNLYTGYTTNGIDPQVDLPISVGDGGYVTTLDETALEVTTKPFALEFNGRTNITSKINNFALNKNSTIKEQLINNGYIIVGVDDDIDGSGSSIYGESDTGRWSKQTIPLNVGEVIKSVSLKLVKVGSPDGNIEVSLRDVAGTSDDYTSGSIVASTVADTTANWYDIPLASYTIPTTGIYSIVVNVPSGDVSNHISWRYEASSTYGGTTYFRSTSVDTGVNWTDADTTDFAFILNEQNYCYGASSLISPITDGEHTVKVARDYSLGLTGAEYIDVSDNVALEFGTGDYTRSFWFYTTSVASDIGLFEHKTDATNLEIMQWDNGGTLIWTVYNGGVSTSTDTTAWTPIVNKWYNIILVRTASTGRKIYIGGVDCTNTSNNGDLGNYSGDNYFGTDGTAYLDGNMQEIRCLNRAINIAEISEYQNLTYSNNNGLQLYLKCNDGTGITVVDSSSNVLNGTATGCTWAGGVSYLSIDGIIYDAGLIKTIPSSVNDWIIYPNPYWNYFKYSISGVEIIKYQPTYMVGTKSYTTGTAKFINGSTSVVGSSSVAWDQTMVKCIIKRDADGTYYVIDSVDEDTKIITLSTAYIGSSVTGAYTISPGLEDLDNNYNGIITLGTNTGLTIMYGTIVSYIPISGVDTTEDIGFNAPVIGGAPFLAAWFSSNEGSQLSELPLYGMYYDTSTGSGIPVATLYVFTNLFFMIFFTTLVIVKTRTIFMGLLAGDMVVLLGIFQHVYPAWILLPLIVISIGVVFIWRQQ